MEVAGKKAVTGRVFEIERYAINDGPGIRTLVFMKGCGLCCLWCSNPESQHHLPQLVYYRQKCLSCGSCVSVCELDALSLTPEGIVINRRLCNRCGECSSVCNAQALVLIGKSMRPEEVLAEVLKDEPFYRKSGGGVTFSGGEPLEQKDFLLQVAQLCKDHYIHTALETCGSVPWGTFEKVLAVIDLFLYDLKEMDPERHREYTGVGNDLILSNFVRLAATGKDMIVRIPVVPGYNDRDENFEMIIDFLQRNSPGIRVDLLPYHEYGGVKYEQLGRECKLHIQPPTEEQINAIKATFERYGLNVQLGG